MPVESSKEEKAFLIKAIWKALQTPKWEKADLITFGTAIFEGAPLSKIAPKTYDAIVPFLIKITDSLEETLTAKAREVAALMVPNPLEETLASKAREVAKASAKPEEPVPAENSSSHPEV